LMEAIFQAVFIIIGCNPANLPRRKNLFCYDNNFIEYFNKSQMGLNLQ